MALRPAVFLDKDGTVLTDYPYNVDPARMVYAPTAFEALACLGATRLPLVVISNQGGVAHGRFPPTALRAVGDQLAQMFSAAGARLDGFYWCPHDPLGTHPDYAIDCDCRKPRPGLLLQAARELQLDLTASWFIGDILDDVQAGHRAGCRAVLLDIGHETQWRMTPEREPDRRAATLYEAARLVTAAMTGQAPVREVAL